VLVGCKSRGPARRPPVEAARVTGEKSRKEFDLPAAGWKADPEKQRGEWREDITKVIRTAGPKAGAGPRETRRFPLAPDNFELRLRRRGASSGPHIY